MPPYCGIWSDCQTKKKLVLEGNSYEGILPRQYNQNKVLQYAIYYVTQKSLPPILLLSTHLFILLIL